MTRQKKGEPRLQPIVGANPEPGGRRRYVTASLLTVIGGAFVVVGTVDISLLWFPLRLGNASWEFASLNRTFGAMPMLALGWLLVASGVLRSSEVGSRPIRVLAAIFFFLGLWVAGMGVLYATVAPAVVQAAPIEAVSRPVIKGTVEALVYTIAFLWSAVLMWRRANSASRVR